MIHTKLYLYSADAQDYKGTDYSKHILQGDQKTDDLTDVLDVVNLTIAGISRAEEFEPTTKFIYEKWYDVYDDDGNATEVLWKSWDIMVAEDLVEQPIISDNNYFNHQITFNEASVVAQGRIVDNIATTYKLKDVSLDTVIRVDSDKEVVTDFIERQGNLVASSLDKAFYDDVYFGRKFRWVFPNWFTGQYASYNSSESDWADLPYYIGVNTDSGAEGITTLTIPIPMLEIQKCIQGTNNFDHEGYCSLRVIVKREYQLTNEVEVLKNDGTFANESNITENDKIVINPVDTNISSEEGTWNYETFPFALSPKDGATSEPRGIIVNRVVGEGGIGTTEFRMYFARVTQGFDTTINPKRLLTFNISNGTLGANYKYNVKIMLDNITLSGAVADLPIKYQDIIGISHMSLTEPKNTIAYSSYARNWYYVLFTTTDSVTQSLSTDNLFASLEFVTYDANNNKELFTAQAPPQSAYELFVKAQLCSQNYEKVEGTPITSLSNLPFYLSSEYEQLLQNTQVVENFYNQKNLWEILIDIGKYIHAIPRITFGDNDRFLVQFDKLGRTEQFEDNAMPISILNSKNIENYISACSSYVTNMVQLGGVIDEWVAPKSSSDDYLVYNDVVEIITSKPIIEIVDMEIKCTNPSHYSDWLGVDMTTPRSMVEHNGYVFEQNVYQLFGVNHSEQLNKGLAIWYALGTNKIQGLTYQLPTVSQGDVYGDYAIKRIIRDIYLGDPDAGNIFPYEVYVNDFIFHIVYRTKDNVRTDQTRPDLRKYMLNTHLDRVPQHNQFNNQQDILADSVKFGNNIYGKLIRTGNSEFTITEWVQDFGQLKQIGQLYNIRGNIYYVAKVNNTFFADHITSVITYSKDYNQLSEIIGIPSEPRFYEISEQSLIEREFSVDDYLILTTEEDFDNVGDTFIAGRGFTYIRNLLFGNQTQFPKYAITVFKNDGDRTYGQVAGNENYYKEVCNAVNTYSVQNTLTIEWDMADNFSAGDEVDDVGATPPSGSVDQSYNKLMPVRYPDVYGRADLIDFYILLDLVDNDGDRVPDTTIYSLPQSPIDTKLYYGIEIGLNKTSEQLTTIIEQNAGREPIIGDIIVLWNNMSDEDARYKICSYIEHQEEIEGEQTTVLGWVIGAEQSTMPTTTSNSIWAYSDNLLFANERTPLEGGDNQHGLALMKDNREAISVNYNLQMLTDSDRFVLSSWLWQPDKQNLKVMCLNTEISKISTDTIPTNYVIAGKTRNLTTRIGSFGDSIMIPISTILADVDLTEVKAIVIASEIPSLYGQYQFVCGRNISDLGLSAKDDWYIYGVNKDFFEKKQ